VDGGPPGLNGDDVRRLAARVEPPRRPWRRTRANVEVWIDADGLIRLASIQRQPLVIFGDEDLARKVEGLAGTRENPVWSTTELTAFGVAVAIPPLASEARRRRFARGADRVAG
jgi:hypothetical protein